MITQELCSQVQDVLRDRFGLKLELDIIHDYIADVNENVDAPYGAENMTDARDIADMINGSIENGTLKVA